MANLSMCSPGTRPPPNSGIGCHKDSRKIWPGCDDALGHEFPLWPSARTVGLVSWRLQNLIPRVDDHIVGNHVIQNHPECRHGRQCGCINRFSCACSCNVQWSMSADAPGCIPKFRRAAERRRLVGNQMVNHTNEMCSMKKSCTCTKVRRPGCDPHTFNYRNSNASTLAERDYDLNFWKDELLRELDILELTEQELYDVTCEAEDAFEETEQPLAIAKDCLDRHHQRRDYDGLHTDEVEETLVEEKKNLARWREKLDHTIELAHAQIRRNGELGVALTNDHHTRHQARRVNCHAHKFNTNPACRPVVPESWEVGVKENCYDARQEREKTKKLIADLRRLLRESSNEIWQFSRVSSNALRANVDRMNRDLTTYSEELAKVERDIQEYERVMLMMTRSIRDQELSIKKSGARIDERARHLNTAICSDAMLANMKKDQRDICETIKLTQAKLADSHKACDELRARRHVLLKNLSIRKSDLQTDKSCIPLRDTIYIKTRGGPIVKIPHVMKHLRHGSALDN